MVTKISPGSATTKDRRPTPVTIWRAPRIVTPKMQIQKQTANKATSSPTRLFPSERFQCYTEKNYHKNSYQTIDSGKGCVARHHKKFYLLIFTFDNNFLRWTYSGPTEFILSWTTLVHATLRVSDIIDKCKSWLADVTSCHGDGCWA